MDYPEEVIYQQIAGKGGNVAVITLNRPHALNALTHEMCQSMNIKLRKWEHDPNIKAVVIRGAGDRAFCAGGDIRYLYYLQQKANIAGLQQFFWDEYRLNYRIHSFPKPWISFFNGITMGGGVGVSVHGSHRVATEHMIFAMPETAIGFFPDVGGSYFLSRCPGELGVYLGLTGAKLNAADAMYAELVDHFIPTSHIDEVIDNIAANDLRHDADHIISEIIHAVEVTTEPSQLLVHRRIIDECFAYDTIEEIIAALKADNSQWTKKIVKRLQQQSPTSLKVTLRQIREGVNIDFDECMKMEYRICQGFIFGNDFHEGIRAMLIDKDRQPSWQPGKIDAVTDEMVDAYFKPLEVGELSFDKT